MNKASEISRLYAIYAKRLNRPKLTVDEFQPLVLNIAYLEIAKAKKNHLPYDTKKYSLNIHKQRLKLFLNMKRKSTTQDIQLCFLVLMQLQNGMDFGTF